MPELLEVLFEALRSPNAIPEKVSLPSLFSEDRSLPADEIKESGISPDICLDELSESLSAEQRFGQSHAKLFWLIGRKVRTPKGPGTLLQVFSGRASVLLDSERDKCSVFRVSQIEPVSVG
jgi:hypothetical protein